MKRIKPPRSIRIIYWLTEAAFGLTILAGILVLAFNILVFTSFFGDDLQLHVELPIKFNVMEKGSMKLQGGMVEVELVEATSRIHFIDTPMYVARIFGSAMLIAFGFIGYLMYLFRRFMVNVKKNRVFDLDNMEYLRNIAYGLLGLWLYIVIYSRIVHHYFLGALSFKHVEVSQDYRNFAGILLLALFMWVLSHVFMVGVRMREEQELTI
jgi:hypothetical protein